MPNSAVILTAEQTRKLVNDILKLLIPQKKVDAFKTSGMTVKEFSEQYMVYLEIVYMRINLTGGRNYSASGLFKKFQPFLMACPLSKPAADPGSGT